MLRWPHVVVPAALAVPTTVAVAFAGAAGAVLAGAAGRPAAVPPPAVPPPAGRVAAGAAAAPARGVGPSGEGAADLAWRATFMARWASTLLTSRA